MFLFLYKVSKPKLTTHQFVISHTLVLIVIYTYIFFFVFLIAKKIMDKIKSREELVEFDEQKWVNDSSLDHKGRVPLRGSTGVWKASLFIIGK